ncbi:ABC transporter permease [Oricola cellulosilytica]|uniref:Nickel/cobalt efflux system n=1 Tax=Oricola cellulosilytica TaxID=1429082 RepID=A0A4V6N697_9HYPH|nr:ABC transporter permease [Oricola cellulosilytica]
MYADAVSAQRDIYLAFADRIREFSETGDWTQLAVFLPVGVVFGAIHAATPGHSKTILASYLAGSRLAASRALAVSFVLSMTHVSMSVLIALLSLPLVSIAFGEVGRAPALENLSRGLIGMIGLWMVWQALRPPGRHDHAAGQGLALGLTAGLIPCPLTLFVMTFAISKGATEAGIAFAGVMMLGVALTLALVAVTAVLCRDTLLRLMERRPATLLFTARLLHGIVGVMLVIIALNEVFPRG